MIDASSSVSNYPSIVDSRLAGGYTTVSYVSGAGTGATIKPNGGDIGKTLFIPNSGQRWMSGFDGFASAYGTAGYYFSAEQSTSSSWAWNLYFTSGSDSSGTISYMEKLNAYSIRCVRS